MATKLSRIEKSKIVFTEILEKRDFSWIDKIFTDFYGIREGEENNTSKVGKIGSGKMGIRLYLNTFIQGLEDVKYSFLNILDCDNQVVMRWRLTAKHVKDIFSIKATQKFINIVGIAWFSFDSEGLIRYVYMEWNGFSLMVQLNLEIKAKEPV